jgi:hypothetical protein
VGLLSWLFGHDDLVNAPSGDIDTPDLPSPGVNPATGLPMLDDLVDVMGNPYGLGEPGGVPMVDDHMGCHSDW